MSKKGNNDPRKKLWSSYVSKLRSCKKRRKENCPICQKPIAALQYYKHVDKCTKLFEIRAKMYNEDVANLDRCVECTICLDNMECGQKIARLKCLCVYHKVCIDLWFNKHVWCPHHPK